MSDLKAQESSRAPGRPLGSTRVNESRRAVAAWLPASEHDRLIQAANRQEMSVSSFIRRVLILSLK